MDQRNFIYFLRIFTAKTVIESNQYYIPVHGVTINNFLLIININKEIHLSSNYY